MIRALIVDDEPIARQVLREQLEDFTSVQIAGEAASGLEAVDLLSRTDPDVVFLDLHMPGLDGFGVARSLRGRPTPLVIYVTAFENHALEAFETGAIDYLLKPVRRERLAAALEKARAHLAGLRPAAAAAAVQPQTLQASPHPELRKIVGRLGSTLHLLSPSDVIAFEAEGDTVRIIASSGRYFADQPLRALEERLPSPPFRRIHRRTLINSDHIRRIAPLTSRRWMLIMSNGLEVVVSRRMAGVIRDAGQW